MKSEKEFLHDISSPLSSVFLLIESVTEALHANPKASEVEIKNIKKAMEALVRIQSLIQGRKTQITTQEKSPL